MTQDNVFSHLMGGSPAPQPSTAAPRGVVLPAAPKLPSPQTPAQAEADVLGNVRTKQQIDAGNETWVTLTPEQAKENGLNPRRIWAINSRTNEPKDLGDVGGTGSLTEDQRKAAIQAGNLDALVGQINRVQQLYNEQLKGVGIGSPLEYLPTQGNKAFDAAAAGLAEQGLAAFRVPGIGAQSDTELRQFVEANKPSSWAFDAANLERLRQLRSRVDQTREALGLPPAQWDGLGESRDETPAVAAPASASPPAGATPPPAGGNSPPSLSAPDQQLELAGEEKLVQMPNMEALHEGYLQLLDQNAPASQVIGWLRSQGVENPVVLRQAAEQATFRRNNPDVPLRSYDISGIGQYYEPTSGWEQAMSAAAGSMPGAYALAAGDFLSGGTLDNLTDDPEAARAAMEVARETNPGATFAGNLSGGVLAALSGEAALARAAGMAPGALRALLADTGMGAAYGAGSADDGSRLAGAGQGALAAGAGSLAGSGAAKVAQRALSPTGGSLKGLYEEGVRPTPGQRLANAGGGRGVKGLAGRTINAAEEALQSVPLVGSAIRGAREEAREQFQRGAFNQALREIGVRLPEGVSSGTKAHEFAQGAFNRIYDEARSGMRVAVDEQLVDDINALAPDIQTLGPQAQKRLQAILANSVKDDLAGDGYKRTISDLGKHIDRYRKGAMAEDQLLGEVLEGVRGALENAARRHSDPDAVKLLDAADSGYARLIRIEEAARRAGGEMGEFTPNQLRSAVQKMSGGVRSRAFLRGDALMQDYAEQGLSLADKLPNSGTADRVMAGYAVGAPVSGGLSYAAPQWTLPILGIIGAAYAPGFRKATKGAFAPSTKNRKTIAGALKRIERLAGASTATTAVAARSGSPETAASR